MLEKVSICRGTCLLLAALLVLGSAGCATYNTRSVQVGASAPHAVSSGGELCLYVDEYASEAKCKKAFDSDLAGEGVLAVLVKIQNNSQDAYEFAAKDFLIREGSSTLPQVKAEEAAGRVKRDAVGRAIGWSLIVPIIAIPVAAGMSVHNTNKVNETMKEDFLAKTLKDGTIQPYREESGFLFYKLPDGRKDLRGLELDMTARKATTQEAINIVTPLPDASFKTPKKGPDDSNDQSQTTTGIIQ